VQAVGKLWQCDVDGRDVEDDHQLSHTYEEQQPPSARIRMGAVRGRHVSSEVSGVMVLMAGTVPVAVGLVAAVVLAMPVKVGEVLAEGPAGVCVGHVELRS
jgi:hypothetical protein